ncbi:hypothetical protein ACIBQX_48990 [Nonomuraea sp. NPDC049714]
MAKILLMYCGTCGGELHLPASALDQPEGPVFLHCPGCRADVQVTG